MRCARLAVLVSTTTILAPQAVVGQTAVERNLPPVPTGPSTPIVAPDLVPGSQDDAPLGASLRGIILLSTDDGLAGEAVDGVSTSRVAQLDNRRVRTMLGRYVGQPLSRKLIAEIEASIARLSRQAGRPFVSLSTPEQEIGAGILQIRVTEFRAGSVSVTGVSTEEAKRIGRAIRVKPGQPIYSEALSEDLAWLNRIPLRDATARFSPATQSNTTDLVVAVENKRPFRVYGGSSNTGSQTTGLARIFIGGIVTLPLPGAFASYQLTGSRDFWYDEGLFGRRRPRYVAQGLRVAIPTFSRENVELTLSDALTNQRANADFTVRQRTSEATLAYRSALSNIDLPAGSGDLIVGIEFKRQHRQVFFGQLTALDVSADLWQGLVGWSKEWFGNGRQGSANVNLHGSPGGISDRSSSARPSALTNGRSASDRYAYATIDLTQSMRLPHGFALSNQLSMQYAGIAVPLSAQIGLGGEGLIRGYTPDDGSFDTGFLFRNQLQLPLFGVTGGQGRLSDQMAPYVFVDAGFGRDRALGDSVTLVSAGVGADYRLGRLLAVGANAGWALTDGQRTRSGDARVQVRATISL